MKKTVLSIAVSCLLFSNLIAQENNVSDEKNTAPLVRIGADGIRLNVDKFTNVDVKNDDIKAIKVNEFKDTETKKSDLTPETTDSDSIAVIKNNNPVANDKNLIILTNTGSAVAEQTQADIIQLQEQIDKQSNEIMILKEAVAKLILEMQELKDRGVNIYVPETSLKEIDSKLSKRVEPISEGAFKEIINILSGIGNDIKKVSNLLDESKTPKITLEEINKKIENSFVVSDKNQVNDMVFNGFGDYSNIETFYGNSFESPRTFKVNMKNGIAIYSKPAINGKKIERLGFGIAFVADKYTDFGWVKIENGGWVKGYELKPAFTSIR